MTARCNDTWRINTSVTGAVVNQRDEWKRFCQRLRHFSSEWLSRGWVFSWQRQRQRQPNRLEHSSEGRKIVLHRTRYSELVGWFSRRGMARHGAGRRGAELSRGGAARIKASCGIKNLCNQLSNLLPHISRPMSRGPLSFEPSASAVRDSRPTLDPPSTLFSRGGCFSFHLHSPLLSASSFPADQRRRRPAFVSDIKYLFS